MMRDFGYLRGPDGALVENAQAGTSERFNHVHVYHEHPRCAMQSYTTHLADVKFLEEIHPWGSLRAAMIEGPDRIAIELVEIT